MNNKNSKVQIYNGMIEYLLESTNYTLKNIADLSNTSIKNIRLIYCESVLPTNFTSEIQLVRLYQMILDININEIEFKKYLPLPKQYRELTASNME